MKKILSSIIVILFLISLVTAASFEFKLDENVNYRFRCLDSNNNYCTSTTKLLMSVEYPDGSNALDNSSMSYNNTYFNITLPTDKIGNGYSAIIVSPTSNGTVTEFSYNVTPSGIFQNSGILITIVLIIFVLFILSFYKIFRSNNKLEFILFSIISYFLLLVFIFMIWQLSKNYLYTMEWIISLFHILFLITLIIMFPFIIFLFVYLFYNIFTEKNMKEMIGMGYSPEEARRYK